MHGRVSRPTQKKSSHLLSRGGRVFAAGLKPRRAANHPRHAKTGRAGDHGSVSHGRPKAAVRLDFSLTSYSICDIYYPT